MQDKIFLIGFMGVGKTFLGEKLAEHLKRDFYDLDCVIEKTAGLDVNDIFASKGEEYFRKMESQILLNWQKPGIISTGGGIVLEEKNRDFLKKTQNKIIWLNPSWEVIRSRIVNSYRPLVLDRSEMELFGIWSERQHLYKECADIIFEGTELKYLVELLD